MANLNPYKITWAVLFPVIGKCTKKDQKKFKKSAFQYSKLPSIMFEHFPTIESAKQHVESLVLGKKYEVLFITDKQFGLIDSIDKIKNVATKKQISEIFIK